MSEQEFRDFWVGRLAMPRYHFVNPATGRAYTSHHIKMMEQKGLWPPGRWISPNRRAWLYSDLHRHFFGDPPTEKPGAVQEAVEPVARPPQAEPEASIGHNRGPRIQVEHGAQPPASTPRIRRRRAA